MSIAKHMHEERIFTGAYRALVVAPTKGMWRGGQAHWRCTQCRFAAVYQEETKHFDSCPRCGSRMESR